MQTTALVHEAHLRLVEQTGTVIQSRAQVFAITANLMRQILVDHARARNSAKRGAGLQPVTPTGVDIGAPQGGVDLLALDQVLQRLAAFDERRARVLELRYFGGMSEEETAEALEISIATVRRDMRLAEAWLSKELGGAKVERSPSINPPE